MHLINEKQFYNQQIFIMSKIDNYKQKFEAQLDSWNADLDKLKAKAKNAEADKKIEYADEIEAMERRLQKAEKELRNFSNASEDAWETFKKDFEIAWNNLSKEHEPAHQV